MHWIWVDDMTKREAGPRKSFLSALAKMLPAAKDTYKRFYRENADGSYHYPKMRVSTARPVSHRSFGRRQQQRADDDEQTQANEGGALVTRAI